MAMNGQAKDVKMTDEGTSKDYYFDSYSQYDLSIRSP